MMCKNGVKRLDIVHCSYIIMAVILWPNGLCEKFAEDLEYPEIAKLVSWKNENKTYNNRQLSSDEDVDLQQLNRLHDQTSDQDRLTNQHSSGKQFLMNDYIQNVGDGEYWDRQTSRTYSSGRSSDIVANRAVGVGPLKFVDDRRSGGRNEFVGEQLSGREQFLAAVGPQKKRTLWKKRSRVYNKVNGRKYDSVGGEFYQRNPPILKYNHEKYLPEEASIQQNVYSSHNSQPNGNDLYKQGERVDYSNGEFNDNNKGAFYRDSKGVDSFRVNIPMRIPIAKESARNKVVQSWNIKKYFQFSTELSTYNSNTEIVQLSGNPVNINIENSNSKENNNEKLVDLQKTLNENIVKEALQLTNSDSIVDNCAPIGKSSNNFPITNNIQQKLENFDTSRGHVEEIYTENKAEIQPVKDIPTADEKTRIAQSGGVDKVSGEKGIYKKPRMHTYLISRIGEPEAFPEKRNFSRYYADRNFNNGEKIDKQNQLSDSQDLGQNKNYQNVLPKNGGNLSGEYDGAEFMRKPMNQQQQWEYISGNEEMPNVNVFNVSREYMERHSFARKKPRQGRSGIKSTTIITTAVGQLKNNFSKQMQQGNAPGILQMPKMATEKPIMSSVAPQIFSVPTPMTMLPAGSLQTLSYSTTNSTTSDGCISSLAGLQEVGYKIPPSNVDFVNRIHNKPEVGPIVYTPVAKTDSFIRVTPTTFTNMLLAEAISMVYNSAEVKDPKVNGADVSKTMFTEQPYQALEIKSNSKSAAVSGKNFTNPIDTLKTLQKSDSPSAASHPKVEDRPLSLVNNTSKFEHLSSGKSQTLLKDSIKPDMSNASFQNPVEVNGGSEAIEFESPYSQWKDVNFDEINRRRTKCNCFPIDEENDKYLEDYTDMEVDGDNYYTLMNKNNPRSMIPRLCYNWVAERENRALMQKQNRNSSAYNGNEDRQSQKIEEQKNDALENNIITPGDGYLYEGDVERLRPMRIDDPELALVRHGLDQHVRHFVAASGNRRVGLQYDDEQESEGVPLITHSPVKYVKWHNLTSGAFGGFINRHAV